MINNKIRYYIFILILAFLILPIQVIAPERLPTVNGDSNTWGTVLNGFLGVILDSVGNLKSNTVNTTSIIDDTILAGDIASGAVGTSEIADGVVSTDDITDSTITTTDISASAGITDGQISNTLTVDGSGSVTFSALATYPTGCTNQFVTTIGDSLTCTSVASASITDAAVSLADMALSSVNTTHIVDDTIAAEDIAADAIGASEIGADVVDASELADTINLGSETSLTFTGSAAGPLYSFTNSAADATANDIMQISFSGISSVNLGTDDTFISFQSSGGELADISGTLTDLLVAYNTFTGGHWSQTNEINLEEGEVLISTGELLENSVQLTKVARTNKSKDSRVYGVYGGSKGNDSNIVYGDGGEIIQVLALGTGVIRVTDTNGNINNGDFITTSIRSGYGQKQDDDLFHSYTTAKATETVDWKKVKRDPKKGFKWKLISATYHAG